MTSEQQPIRIAIADDHPMVISGLQNMMQQYPHICLTDAYPNAATLLQGLRQSLPDVLLLDIQMPDQTGNNLAPQLLRKYPQLKILTLTNLDSALYAYNMLRNGVHGYLLKTTSQETLIRAIETVYRGETFIEPSLTEKLRLFTARMRREASLKATLSVREKEVLQLIVNGYTSQEIADKIHLGLRTVESYRFNILLKLDVKNTATLVRKAVELGLVE